MGNTVFGVAVDAANAATLAGFWALLGRQVADRVPEPRTSKNRLQDLIAADFDAETA